MSFREQYHRKKKYPTLPLTVGRLEQQYPSASLSTIYEGIPRSIDPRPISEPSLPQNWSETRKQGESSDVPEAPYDRSDVLGRSVIAAPKRKNYRGRPTKGGVKVLVVRPQIVDTTKLASFTKRPEKNILPVVKKVDSGITIKVLNKIDDGKKRIVLKDPR